MKVSIIVSTHVLTYLTISKHALMHATFVKNEQLYRVTHLLETLVELTSDLVCCTLLLGQLVPTESAHQPGELLKVSQPNL